MTDEIEINNIFIADFQRFVIDSVTKINCGVKIFKSFYYKNIVFDTAYTISTEDLISTTRNISPHVFRIM